MSIGLQWWLPTNGAYSVVVMIDVICWMDMVLNFRTGYVDQGHLVMDPTKIFMKYLKHWFFVDLIGNIPWETLIESLQVTSSQRKSVKLLKWLKIPKLLRLGRLRNVLRGHFRYLNLLLAGLITLGL